jgi:N-acetylneuraminate synthase
MSVRIGSTLIGEGHPCYVIAEIGINHNGFVEKACALIDVAVAAGANAVKFQKRTVEVVFTPEEMARPRQIPTINGIMKNAIHRGVLSPQAVERLTKSDYENTLNGDLKIALEFTELEYRQIDEYCKAKNIAWFASPWDEQAVDFLEQFNVPCHKIASASLTDKGLLERIKATGKTVMLSTGMSDIDQIRWAVKILGKENLILMHAVSIYPANDPDVNLEVIGTLKREFPGVPVGYSGHEKDILPSVMAASMGAAAIERHLTLDYREWGSDQASSIEPKVFAEMIEQVRRVAIIHGSPVKKVDPREVEVMKKLRRKTDHGV